MPFGSVKLVPGVNVERTPTLLQAGYSQSSLIRFRDGLAQKYGGWTHFYAQSLAGTPRDLHAWQDLNQVNHLAVGTTQSLRVITRPAAMDITPQTFTSDFSPNFSTVMNTAAVTIVDPNISNVTIYDTIYFNTPVSIGGIILSGAYPIISIVSATTYTITAAIKASSTVNNAGAVPVFTTTGGGAQVSVLLTAHGVIAGNTVVFPIATTGDSVTIKGSYTVVSVADANHFTITVTNTAMSGATFSMNGGNAELVYYIQAGPQAPALGFGVGGFGVGGYGTGTTGGAQTGTPLVASDYTSDNWGEILIACPAGGGIYTWDPTGGFPNAGLIPTAPIFNGGIFVSISTQILVAWGSTVTEQIGTQQDPMLVKWSDQGNFAQWAATSTTQAGSFRIPIGSKIVGGMAVSLVNLIWTDLDLWSMSYIGQPLVFSFQKIGAGAGMVSSHAAQQFRGSVYWMGQSNFYVLSGNGVQVLSCPVWDTVFQNLDTLNLAKVRAMPNTPFNEIGWLFPSQSGGTGENDTYVKMNVTEQGQPWDTGPLMRSGWTDQSVFGAPLSTGPVGGIFGSSPFIFQHETGNNAGDSPMASSFTTGYFVIAEGEEFAFVDQVLPDMKWGTVAGSPTANVQFTFNVVNFAGDTPSTYGPYTVTQTTEFIPVRFRGRMMSITVASSDINSFWRLGNVRYRWAPAGRR